MSFLKINDPAKRDLIVEDFLKTKKNIQQNFLSEKLGDIGRQRELTKLYKPIVDSQSTISKEQNALLSTIKENLAATSNALQALPASISSTIKAIQYPSKKGKDGSTLQFGDIATPYMLRHASKDKTTDKIFGIRTKGEKFYIGDAPITIQGDDITVVGKTYAGTQGLWELMTMEEPNNFDEKDYSDYSEILRATNAMRQEKNPNKPRSSAGLKWNNIVKHIWEAKTGEGVVVIPQDINALVPMLSLRLASFQAGNTGVRNEIVGICEELLRQGVIDSEQYKNLMLQL